jgi:hypothetical protein
MRVTRESKRFLSSFLTLFRTSVHHLSMLELSCGSGMFRVALVRTLNQTCLAWVHWVRIWSTLSSSCKHVKHGSGKYFSPCTALRSAVHNLYFIANQAMILHFKGANDFHIGVCHVKASHMYFWKSKLQTQNPSRWCGPDSRIAIYTMDRLPRHDALNANVDSHLPWDVVNPSIISLSIHSHTGILAPSRNKASHRWCNFLFLSSIDPLIAPEENTPTISNSEKSQALETTRTPQCDAYPADPATVVSANTTGHRGLSPAAGDPWCLAHQSIGVSKWHLMQQDTIDTCILNHQYSNSYN